ncbi:MAG: SsrA-binding protein SmpB [Thermotogae bacterium]|nr:SsrA-binding protein SmpB [Thermotogota bacterium]
MKVVATNRKAYHDYHIVETFEAGIELKGTEVKALREGRVNLKDSFCKVVEGELYLINCHISPYRHGSYFNHDPERPRKLLMHKKEIVRLGSKVAQEGYTLIPLRIYFNNRGWAKVEIALAKGKKKYDKREDIIRREQEKRAREYIKYGVKK